MVDLESLGYRPFMEFVGVAMGGGFTAIAVASSTYVPLPQPAAFSPLDERPEKPVSQGLTQHGLAQKRTIGRPSPCIVRASGAADWGSRTPYVTNNTHGFEQCQSYTGNSRGRVRNESRGMARLGPHFPLLMGETSMVSEIGGPARAGRNDSIGLPATYRTVAKPMNLR